VGELRYRTDLFAGTAEHYERFRPPYPKTLLDDVRARLPLRGTGRLLDLACGTGQVGFALAGDVTEVWAVDQEPEAIALATGKARDLGVGNIRWIAAPAEEVPLDGAFDLVTIGNAFHRLDRDLVATRLLPHLAPGAGVALLWGGGPWPGAQTWQRVLHATLERWRDVLGVRDRVPEGWEDLIESDPHADVLRRSGLDYEGKFEFPVIERWTAESLIGYVYSTSMLSRSVFGDHVEAFEDDVRTRLGACGDDGIFEQRTTFAYELARAPDTT
jgi:SAM-dependent methyltransferase